MNSSKGMAKVSCVLRCDPDHMPDERDVRTVKRRLRQEREQLCADNDERDNVLFLFAPIDIDVQPGAVNGHFLYTIIETKAQEDE